MILLAPTSEKFVHVKFISPSFSENRFLAANLPPCKIKMLGRSLTTREEAHLECILRCENDVNCISECTRDITKCING